MTDWIHIRVGLIAGIVFLMAACTAPAFNPAGESGLEESPSTSPKAQSPSPQPASTSTSTPTITPTSTPHPLEIEWLRWQDYPGSEVMIEERLEPGPNYFRYLASYQSEGNRIFALLTVPYGEKPVTGWPVVVFNHGYIPPEDYRTTERYVAYVNAFASNGYIVFRSDYRGHGSSEGFARGGYGAPDYTVDVLNALTSIQRYEEADPDRVGMWGHSMGGYITLRSMVVSEGIKAGVIWAGVVAPYPDLLERWRRHRADPDDLTATPRPRGWRMELLTRFGRPEENPAFWASISANSFLEDLSGPLQLHHGTGDTSVPFEFSAQLAEQVRAVGGAVEYFEYPGDNHNLANSFSTAMQRSIDFFDVHVKGIGD